MLDILAERGLIEIDQGLEREIAEQIAADSMTAIEAMLDLLEESNARRKTTGKETDTDQ